MTQQNPSAVPRSAPSRPSLDPLDLTQFLALQEALLRPDEDPRELPHRLAHAVRTHLGVDGVAVANLGERIVLRASSGAGPVVPRDEDLSRLRGGTPAVWLGHARRTLAVPFRHGDEAGALLVTTPLATPPVHDTVELATALAALVGMALAASARWAQLGSVARIRSEALTAMAHDLRSPLNALIGYATLLAEGAFGAVTPEQAEVAASMERQARELVDLVGAAVDVARLESGRLPLRVEAFALEDVHRALCEGTFARSVRAGILVWPSPAGLPPLTTDRVKLKEILQNLIENALRHRAGSRVSVDAALARGGDGLRVTVRDQGPGIPPAVLPHLFEPVHADQAQGTGFGLYIVRGFVEALGGRVTVHSGAAAGTTFAVEIPLTAPER